MQTNPTNPDSIAPTQPLAIAQVVTVLRPLDAQHTSRHNSPVETRCAQCNAPMTCKQESGCWCAELPHVIPMPEAGAQSAGCLCRTCLLEKIKAAGAFSASGEIPIPNSTAPLNLASLNSTV